MATRRTPAPRPATAPAPQDHQPKADAEESTVVTVELDGHEIRADMAAFANMRLMRKVRKEDIDALIELFESVFPDLDQIEQDFNLTTYGEYAEFMQRVQEQVPNS